MLALTLTLPFPQRQAVNQQYQVWYGHEQPKQRLNGDLERDQPKYIPWEGSRNTILRQGKAETVCRALMSADDITVINSGR
jgi:hypothetical protein